MQELMYTHNGVGLAAPQIGESVRLFVWDIRDGSGPQAIANPQITETWGSSIYPEGCLSIPGESFVIERANGIKMSGQNLFGEEIAFEVENLKARVFQHEFDHINGVLVSSYL